ncbi:hypothetical protein WCE55_12580 [Luteimonas sp. MJ293]|uniref:hypothetical protein n=1 Tax=Luteimonas sp. MJ146 TaxID=3129240 RepID=UPI0031BB0F32
MKIHILGLAAALFTSNINAGECGFSSSVRMAASTFEVAFPERRSLIQVFQVSEREGDANLKVCLSYWAGGEERATHLETLGPEGRAAEFASVFTLDADGDGERELFMVAKWPVRHEAIRTSGALYRVYVYRKSVGGTGRIEIRRADNIEARLGAGFDGMQEGEQVSFSYKDYESIRNALLR